MSPVLLSRENTKIKKSGCIPKNALDLGSQQPASFHLHFLLVVTFLAYLDHKLSVLNLEMTDPTQPAILY